MYDRPAPRYDGPAEEELQHSKYESLAIESLRIAASRYHGARAWQKNVEDKAYEMHWARHYCEAPPTVASHVISMTY